MIGKILHRIAHYLKQNRCQWRSDFADGLYYECVGCGKLTLVTKWNQPRVPAEPYGAFAKLFKEKEMER